MSKANGKQLLARIDERTKNQDKRQEEIHDDIKEIKDCLLGGAKKISKHSANIKFLWGAISIIWLTLTSVIYIAVKWFLNK